MQHVYQVPQGIENISLYNEKSENNYDTANYNCLQEKYFRKC